MEQKFIFYGAGEAAQNLHPDFAKRGICFVDSNPKKWGTRLHGLDVHPPSYLQTLNKPSFPPILITIINAAYSHPIRDELVSAGFTLGTDIFLFEDIAKMKADELIKQNFSIVKPIRHEYELPASPWKKACVKSNYDEAEYLFMLYTDNWSASNRLKLQYELMNEAYIRGVPLPKPALFKNDMILRGEYRELYVMYYLLLEWINGGTLSIDDIKKERNLAIICGEILKQIHSVPVPIGVENEILQRIHDFIDNEPAELSNAHAKHLSQPLMKYIRQNIRLAHNRPIAFLHGDFGIVNIMLSAEGELKIIDFNSYSFGDPLYDFICIGYDNEFAAGVLQGYFNGTPSKECLKLINLYTAFSVLRNYAFAIELSNTNLMNIYHNFCIFLLKKLEANS